MKASDDTRRELLAVLARLSDARPNWRLGQTIANLATMAGKHEAGAVWDLEDDEALAAAKALLDDPADNAAAAAATRQTA